MKVLRLKEFGDSRFRLLMEELEKNNNDRNSGWWSPLLKQYNNKDRYLDWFFVLDGEKLAGFSTIQPFYKGCFRVLTRCFVFPEYRRFTLPEYDEYMSPGSYMVKEQLKYLEGNYDTVFISLEKLSRQRTIINMSNKMKINTQLDWYVADGMFLTCNAPQSQSCWQNVCYSGQPPLLQRITKAEWKERYGMRN